ncbi:MAG: hypothetical protein NWF01_09655 [Candidatus Bathyarchaeota archaeon]|nr:hypothetical protein [Candidatus Bathyarchaeota archaeon]
MQIAASGNTTAYGNITIDKSNPVIDFYNGATFLGNIGSDNTDFSIGAQQRDLILGAASKIKIASPLSVFGSDSNYHDGVSTTISWDGGTHYIAIIKGVIVAAA